MKWLILAVIVIVMGCASHRNCVSFDKYAKAQTENIERINEIDILQDGLGALNVCKK